MTPVTEQALYGRISPSPQTILVVEDEEPIRLLLTEFLQDYGYNVLEAANVAEAKRIFATNAPIDLVFSDINMPGSETGFALAKWIQSHFANTKVLLTSGAPHSHQDTKDLREPVIPKPYSWHSVLKRIQDQL